MVTSTTEWDYGSPAQQPRPILQRVPPAAPALKQVTASSPQSLERSCREFLASADELRSRFADMQGDELLFTEERARRCVELPSIRVRRAAFDASTFMRNELWARTMRDNDVVGGLLLQQDKQELEKQRASFAEVANFAVALYKQNEQYKEEWTKVLVAYGDLWDRYQELYKVADDAVHLAEKALYRSPGLSLPVFVNVPTPQVIRVEARAVPRSLYCTANTVDMSLGGSTTWTDCRW